MSRTRLSLLLAVFAMAVVAVGGFFLAVQPQLAQAAAARAQTQTVSQTNDSSRAELGRLREQAAKLPAMKRELTALSTSVPDTASIPPFIDELNALAAAAGMKVSSFTASDATAYAPAAAAEAPSSNATGAASAQPSATPSASAVPAAPTAPSAVTNAAITGQNLSVIPVTVAVDGTFDQALSFVKGVQNGQRLFLVTTISSAQKSGDDGAVSGTSTWTFGGSVYVLDRTSTTPAAAATNG
ncbi:type 4a pilus biogenesis protein PilO [Curtobacterium sp. L1-20]|uniref:type 4a pilus biogenesis protein PilO n=1 Tax=Curtobacterium sp. L1-20 TaxID=3138181 RepID=UPI003B51DB80